MYISYIHLIDQQRIRKLKGKIWLHSIHPSSIYSFASSLLCCLYILSNRAFDRGEGMSVTYAPSKIPNPSNFRRPEDFSGEDELEVISSCCLDFVERGCECTFVFFTCTCLALLCAFTTPLLLIQLRVFRNIEVFCLRASFSTWIESFWLLFFATDSYNTAYSAS